MRISDLRDALAELNLSQAEFGRAIGVNANTVTRWMKGTTPVPKVVGEYLRLRLSIHRFAEAAKG
jgi:transcriptional regulator with XRE-family HTH domain